MKQIVKILYICAVTIGCLGFIIVPTLYNPLYNRILVGIFQPLLDLLTVIGILLILKDNRLSSHSGLGYLLVAYVSEFIYISIYHYHVIPSEMPPIWSLFLWNPFVIFLIIFWSRNLLIFLKKDYENKTYFFVVIIMILVCFALGLHFRDLVNYRDEQTFKVIFYKVSVIFETINIGILISVGFLLNKFKSLRYLILSIIFLFCIEFVFCNVEFTNQLFESNFDSFPWEIGWSLAQILTCGIIIFKREGIIAELNELHSEFIVKSNITLKDSLIIFLAGSMCFISVHTFTLLRHDYFTDPLTRSGTIFLIMVSFSLFIAYVLPNYKKSSMEIQSLKINNILLISVNQLDNPLDIEKEIRDLQLEVKGTRYRDNFQIMFPLMAAASEDIIKRVRTDNPTIVHFSGHGSQQGIYIRDSSTNDFVLASGEKLSRFFEGRNVDLVVLNSCYSKNQVNELSKVVKTVIGTLNSVPDKAAKQFTKSFYSSLCDGFTIEEALKDGKDAANFENGDVYFSVGKTDYSLIFKEYDE